MKLIYTCFISAFLLFIVGCQTAEVNQNNQPLPSPTVENKTVRVPETTGIVDVPKLAEKSVAEVDKMLGKAQRAKPIKDPLAGEYREYKIPNHPKGLAIRFYGDKATSFNLILSKTFPTSKETLREAFGVDVGDAPPKIDSKEPLSEVWQGTFNGVRFAKIYAKRERENGGFIFVLAEVAE